MSEYEQQLEKIITDVLLPVYIEHYRLLGRPSPINEINSKLLDALKCRKKVAYILQRQKYE